METPPTPPTTTLVVCHLHGVCVCEREKKAGSTASAEAVGHRVRATSAPQCKFTVRLQEVYCCCESNNTEDDDDDDVC